MSGICPKCAREIPDEWCPKHRAVEPLPETTARVYRYIKTFIEKERYSPDYRQIMAGTGLKSTSTVNYHVRRLADLGLIERPLRQGRVSQVIRLPLGAAT